VKLFFAQITISTSGSPFFKIQSTNIFCISQLREPSHIFTLEAEIGQLVYQLYGLTAEEIAIVAGATAR
jgi:hypothetical protein